MNALLGRIEEVISRGDEQFDIAFTAIAVQPDLRPVPDWLKDQRLTIERYAADVREIGVPGDSIPLTVAESTRFLTPLTAEPAVCVADETVVKLRLRWHASGASPSYKVTANGRLVAGTFEKNDTDFVATVDVAPLFPQGVSRATAVHIAVEKLSVSIPVIADEASGEAAVAAAGGASRRLWNDWYSVDILTERFGGAIASLRERGRDIDHLALRTDRIPASSYNGFHVDRLRSGWGWDDRMKSAAIKSAGSRPTSLGVRLSLDGIVDEGSGIRTSAAYTLYYALPLLSYGREYPIGPAKPLEGDKPTSPKTPIDAVIDTGMGIRTSTRTDDSAPHASKVLVVQDGALRTYRLARARRVHDAPLPKIEQGWILSEHASRSEWMLHLFDPISNPVLSIDLSPGYMVVEPYFDKLPLTAGESAGYSVGITAGEAAGASERGAWVAVKRRIEGGIAVGIVARLAPDAGNLTAQVQLGAILEVVPLKELATPFGTVHYAVVDFIGGGVDKAVHAQVAGIGQRGAQ